MEIKKRTEVKVTDIDVVSILEYTDGTLELAHKRNGEICYDVTNDVIMVTRGYKWEPVEQLVAEIIADVLYSRGYTASNETEAQVTVETFTYRIWVAVDFDLDTNKLTYSLTTINLEREEDTDRNEQERKTWKGLKNYIERFDR